MYKHKENCSKRIFLKPILGSIAALILGVAAASFFLLLHSEEPLETLYAFFISPFTNLFYLGNLLDHAGLILLCALGFSFSVEMGFFNLGGEGQAYTAALVAVLFANTYSGIAQPFGWLFGCLVAFFTAALFGFIAACLKQFLHINELISTYLLSCAVIPLIDYGIVEVFRDPSGSLLATPPITPDWQFLPLMPPSTLNISILISAAAVFIMLFIMHRTRYGYELHLTGSNPVFAQTQGINTKLLSLLTLSIGAGIHGLAGAFCVYGSRHYAYVGITGGLGWSGMAAALIGRNHPFGMVFGALFFAWIEAGGKSAMLQTNFSFEFSAIVQGMAFLLVTIDVLSKRNSQKKKNGIVLDSVGKKKKQDKGVVDG